MIIFFKIGKSINDEKLERAFVKMKKETYGVTKLFNAEQLLLQSSIVYTE